jgi:hypothetical protein
VSFKDRAWGTTEEDGSGRERGEWEGHMYTGVAVLNIDTPEGKF